MLFVTELALRATWFCLSCGRDFGPLEGCTCDLAEGSSELLDRMMTDWGMEAGSFNTLLPYPKNWLLLDVGPDHRFFSCL